MRRGRAPMPYSVSSAMPRPCRAVRCVDLRAARADNYSEIHVMGSPTMQQPMRKQQQDAATPNQAFDLRSTLQWLRSNGELIETDKEVDPDLQITGLQKHMDGGCPVLFNNVKDRPNHRVITNLFGDMAIINKMFGWQDD